MKIHLMHSFDTDCTLGGFYASVSHRTKCTYLIYVDVLFTFMLNSCTNGTHVDLKKL